MADSCVTMPNLLSILTLGIQIYLPNRVNVKTSKSASDYTQAILDELKHFPKDAELFINLGEAYLREGKFGEALKAYERASELDPSSSFQALYWEWVATVREAADDKAEALKAYAKWAECDPTCIEPIDRSGAIMVSEGQWTDLLLLRSQYAKLAEVAPTGELLESLALYAFIIEQIGGENKTPPMELTYSALEVNPKSIAMRYLMAALFARNGQIEGAKAEFLKVIEMDEDNTWNESRFSLNWNSTTATLMLGRLARLQRRFDEAIAYFGKCIKTEIGCSLEPFEEVITLLLELGRYEEALELVPKQVVHLQLAPWMQRLRARALLGLGQIEEAAKLYSVEEEPSQPEPQKPNAAETTIKEKLAAANALLDHAQYSQALEAFEALNSTYSDPIAGVVGWARCKKALGDAEASIAKLEKLVKEHPENTCVWELLSELYRDKGDTLRYRLSRIQIQAMICETPNALENEWIAPAAPDSGSIGLGISARALKGTGRLTITGVSGAEAPANIAWTYLRAEAERLGVPLPESTDMHIHVRNLGSEPRGLVQSGDAALGLLGDLADIPVCNEDIGLAAFLAMASALSNTPPSGMNVAGGRLDLLGGIYSSPTLAAGLSSLNESGIRWNRVILPRTVTTELDRLPAEIWTTADVFLCANAPQAVRAITE